MTVVIFGDSPERAHKAARSLRGVGAAAGLTAGGLLWAGAMVLDLSGGGFPVVAFAVGLLLSGASLPGVARRPEARSRRLATAGTTLVLVGLALALLFNLQGILLLARWAGLLVADATLAAGRRAVPFVAGGGLVLLAAAWDRARGELPVRVALAAVGGAGVLVAFTALGRLLGAWYLALGALWVFLGMGAWLDARRAAPSAR